MSTSASEFLVGKADAGTRLDHFLTAHATDLSRSRLQALVRDGSVTVDGAIVSPGKKLRAGERIILTVPLPVAASCTAASATTFPCTSFAVTVIVELPVPAGIEPGAATTVDWPASTAPAVTVTSAVWVIPVPFAIAETDFSPATFELSDPV